MAANATNQSGNRLSLRSQLCEIQKLPAWIEGLAARHAIPSNLHAVMCLCLEEVLSNTIRHGYGSATDRPLILLFTMPQEGYFVFVVEDEAPRFNPLDAPELPALNACEPIPVGGQGIRFLHQFADTLEYEPTPDGNRIRMGFYDPASAARRD